MSTQSPDFFQDELDGTQLAAMLAARGLTTNVVVESLWHGRTVARRNAAEALVLLDALPDTAEPLLPISARDSDALVRRRIILGVAQKLGRTPIAVPILFDGLVASDEDVRHAAFEGLATRLEQTRAEVLPFIVDGLGDLRPLVVGACVKLLTENAGVDAVPLLVLKLGSGDPRLEKPAFDVLDRLKWDAIAPLVAALVDPAPRRLLARLLTSVGEVDAAVRQQLEALRVHAETSSDAAFQETIELIIRETSRPVSILRTAPLDIPIDGFLARRLDDATLQDALRSANIAVSELLHALGDGRSHVRDNALRSLRFSVLDAAAKAVASAKVMPLVRDGDEQVRIAALGTLPVFGPAHVGAGAVVGLGDREDAVRDAARGVLVASGGDGLASALQTLQVQAAIGLVVDGFVAAVVAIGAPAVPFLADVLAEGAGLAPVARIAAARGLGALGRAADDGLSVLLQALTEPLEDVRQEVARAIGLIGVDDPAIIGALKAQLRDSVATVRREAALAIANITGKPIDDRSASEPRPVPVAGFELELLTEASLILPSGADVVDLASVLAQALRDGRPLVRRNAARVIAFLGNQTPASLPDGLPESLIVRLALGLRDGEVDVRRDVARALLGLGDAGLPAAAFAIASINDPDADVANILVAFVAGLHPAAEGFILEGLRVEPDIADRGIFRVLSRLEGRIVLALGKKGLFHSSGLIRLNSARALELLAKKGADAVVDELREALSDHLGQVRNAAEAALDAIVGLKPRPVRVLEPVPLPFAAFDSEILPASSLQQQLDELTASDAETPGPALLARLLADGRDIVRANAARLSTLIGPWPELAGPLTVLLRDSEPSVRAAAIDGVRIVATPLVAARAITPCLAASAPEVIASAQNALEAIGVDALPALVEAASRLSDRDLVRQLSRLFRPLLSPTLVYVAALLAPDSQADDVLRGTALRVIRVFSREQIGDVGSIHATLESYAERGLRSPDGGVRRAAAAALDRLSGRDTAPAALEPSPLPLPDFDARLFSTDQLAAVAGDLRFDLLIHCLSDGRETVRANAVAALGLLGAAQISAIGPLRRMLRDGSSEVRERAATALGNLPPSRDASFELVEALLDGAPAVVSAARDALKAAGTFAIEALVFGLDDEPRLAGRTVIPVLVEIGDPALDALVLAARHASPLVRRNALISLRFFPRDQALTARAAVASLERDEDRNVRLEARITRAWLDGIDRNLVATEPLPLPHPEFVFRGLSSDEIAAFADSFEPAQLAALLRDGRRRVRENAARSFGVMGVFHAWLGFALKDDELEVQRAAARTLLNLGAKALAAAPQLIDALDEDDAPVCIDARAALVSLGVEALPAIIAASRMPPDRFRRNLLVIIDRIGEAAVPAMISALEHASAFVVMNALMAIEVLAERGGKVAMERVVALTRHPLPAMVRIAQACLMRLEGRTPAEFRKEAVPMPIPGYDIASLPVDVLVANGPLVDRDWLRSAIFDGREKVRENSARLLGCLGAEGEDYISLLVIALKDPEGEVQIAAAEALGMLAAGDEVAIPALIATLRFAREALRRALLTALDRFGPARVSAVAVHHLVGLEDKLLASMGRVAHRMSEAFVPALSAVAADREASLIARENAVVILGDLTARARAAETPLVSLVNHQDGMLAFKAATALGRLGTPGPALADRLMAASMAEKRPSVVQALRNSAKSLRRRRVEG